MFSDRFFGFATFWINWVGCPLGAAPYKLDFKRKRLYTFNRARRHCIHVWMFLASHNVFLAIMLLYYHLKQDFNAFNHAYLGWVMSSIWCLVLGVGAFRADMMVYVFNAYLAFFDRYTSK